MSTCVKIPFQTIDWTAVEKTIHHGETGTSLWQTVQLPGMRIRIVEYSAGYRAGHWCTKGHIVHCLKGAFVSEMENGETFEFTEGMSYVVSDELSVHRSVTREGARLFIIDGDFLKQSI